MADDAHALIEYKLLRAMARNEALARLVISSFPEDRRQSVADEIRRLELEFFDGMLAHYADRNPAMASKIRRMLDA